MQGRILLVDDDETFLLSTADLLRREGYECICEYDSFGALDRLADNCDYDLIVADIKMPGNGDLEFLEEVENKFGTIPVIIITGYPSQRTAVKSTNLSVFSYLIKPFCFDNLKDKVSKAVNTSLLKKNVTECKSRLKKWLKELNTYEKYLKNNLNNKRDLKPHDYLDSLIGNISSMLLEIKSISSGELEMRDASQIQFVKFEEKLELLERLKDTVSVLEETKHAFKSKRLADLRKGLEKYLENNNK